MEAGEAPGGAFRIGGLIISIEARCDILGVADAGERQFFDHETCDDLRFLRNLKGCFLCEQFFLSHEKRQKLDLLAIECVVNITQPFILMVVEPLSFVAEQDDGAAPGPGGSLTDA